MKTMKLSVLSFLLLIAATYSNAQNPGKKYLFDARLNLGVVANSAAEGKFAYGAGFETLIKMKEIASEPGIVGSMNRRQNARAELLTFGLKLMSNPFKGSSFLVTSQAFNKDGSDALNYALLLAGYRFAFGVSDNPNQWFYLHPRIGIGLSGGFRWAGLSISPAAGYIINRFDFQIFVDGGFGGKKLSIGKKSFVTPGVSVGYAF